MPRKTDTPKPRRGRPRVIPGPVPDGARWHSLLITDEERAACNALVGRMRRKAIASSDRPGP